MVVRCEECHQILSPVTIDDGKQYTCSCGSNFGIFPIVKGVIVRRSGFKSRVAVLVNCPFCGKKHYHNPQPLPSLRKSHCIDYDGNTGNFLGKYPENHPLGYKDGSYYYYIYVWEQNRVQTSEGIWGG